jgi:hypothetical protein
MAHQTKIRFRIEPNGVTHEQVEGVKGNQCAIITSPIETALGPVIKRENTIDFKRTNERLQNLEEEDWRELQLNRHQLRLENLEEEDWR